MVIKALHALTLLHSTDMPLEGSMLTLDAACNMSPAATAKPKPETCRPSRTQRASRFETMQAKVCLFLAITVRLVITFYFPSPQCPTRECPYSSQPQSFPEVSLKCPAPTCPRRISMRDLLCTSLRCGFLFRTRHKLFVARHRESREGFKSASTTNKAQNMQWVLLQSWRLV